MLKVAFENSLDLWEDNTIKECKESLQKVIQNASVIVKNP